MSFKTDKYKGLLLARAVGLNALYALLAGAALGSGYLAPVYAADTTWLVSVITALTLLGVGQTLARIYQVGSWLDARMFQVAMSKRFLARMQERVMPLHFLASTLVLLGLIGTVLGVKMATAAVGAADIADVSALTTLVPQLMAAMAVALDTTIAGALGALILESNIRILEGGLARAQNVVEHGS